MPVRARFRPHHRGFGFLTIVDADGSTPTSVTATKPNGAPGEYDSLFVPPDTAGTLIADDLVEAEFEVDDKGATATDVTVVDRARRMLVGTVQTGPAGIGIEPDRQLASRWMPASATLAEQLKLQLGRQVVVMLGQTEDGAPMASALVAGPHVVGSPDAVRARASVIALGRAAPSLVPGGAQAAGLDPVEAVTTHLRHLGTVAGGQRGPSAGLAYEGQTPGAYVEPTDRQDEPCLTIDDATTRDIDDAITAHWDHEESSAVEVAVHIADVAAYVGIDSPADRYARTVATSTYFAVGPNAPMLDPALSEGILSLLPGEERWALSVRFDVQPDGSITDVRVENVAIRSRAQLTYHALDEWLDGDATELYDLAKDQGSVAEDILINAVEAAHRLGVERESRDTFEDLFDDAEVRPAVVNGKLSTVDAAPHARAYRLIERLMVAANESVAGWLVEREVPALYRAHVGLNPDRAERLRAAVAIAGADVPALADPDAEVPAVMGQLLAEIERLETEGKLEDRNLLVSAATGSTARASYDPDPSHHRGLASGAYCHFTSPIRRYADLVVHRQIRASLANEEPLHKVEELEPLARWLDARAGAANHLQALERGDLWSILLDRGHLKGAEPAVVTGLTNNGIKIRLPRLGLNGFLTAEKALGLAPRERGSLKVDEHGLTTTSGPWRVGSRIKVRASGLDDTGRPVFRLGDGPKKPPSPTA